MGLYHSIAVAYGFEIPNDTDLDQLDKALGDGPDLLADSVGQIVVGDYEQLLLVTRYTRIEENTVLPLAPGGLATVDEMTAWNEALNAVAARIGQAAHPQPGWLVIHNYR
ncbi:hypothetical protein ACWERV_17175 [Streptomyces sp. NPDC004031]